MARVFMSIAAAEGNLGDIHIRRNVVEMVANHVDEGVVYAGSMSANYVEAYNLPEGWTVSSSPAYFLKCLIFSGIRRQAIVIMAPGPAPLSTGPLGSVKRLGVAVGFSGLRIWGNRFLVLGRALRGSGRTATWSERLMAKNAHIYTTRDRISADIAGGAAEYYPDIAFRRIDGIAESARGCVAISLRYDREICKDAIASLISEIKSRDLQPVFVTQVKEDALQHKYLSESLGCSLVDWPESITHSQQETVLDSFYAQCVAVISDRLHVLILAARRGAIPVIVDTPDENKLHASLDDFIKPGSVELHRKGRAGLPELSDFERDRVREGLRLAGEEIDLLESRLGALLRRGE